MAVDSVEWKKDQKVLKPSDKYKMRLEGRFAELTIQDLEVTDAGNYTCVCGDQKTIAAVKVNGNRICVRYDSLLTCGSVAGLFCGGFPISPYAQCIYLCLQKSSCSCSVLCIRLFLLDCHKEQFTCSET